MMAEQVTKSIKARQASQRHSVPLDVLVVDDDEATRLTLTYALTDAGNKVTQAADGAEAIARADEHTYDVAILDVRLPGIDGLAVFRHLRSKSPTTAVILMTAFATVADAVASLREGAYDYVTKPFDAEEFSLRVIGHIAEHRALRQELEEARKLVASRDAGSPIIGVTPAMVQLVERINMVAQSEAPVLVRGEPGTGKELIARTLHARGPRKAGPFVAVNCAAFPEALVEAELFGQARGVLGALRGREGRLKAADGGTILLEQVADLPLPAQAKLVRVLESGAVLPVGEDETTPVNVRVVTATQVDLKERVAQGRFREDLLLRLNVLDLAVPPLRERRADMPLLVAHFLRRFNPGRVPPGITPRAWAAMTAYDWPGNVRELAQAIERAVVLAHGSEIDLEHLPADVAAATSRVVAVAPGDADATRTEREAEGDASLRPLAVALTEFERAYILRALRASKHAKSRAARALGISQKSLAEKLRRHGIEDAPARR